MVPPDSPGNDSAVVHSALKSLLLEHAEPTVLFEPLTKLTGAHYHTLSELSNPVRVMLYTYLVKNAIGRIVNNLNNA